MSAQNKNGSSPDKVDLFEKLVATIPDVKAKGAANKYTSLNGNMFSLLSPPGTLALRLPEEEREKFLKKYKTKLYEAYGVVMREYVTVPDALLRNTKQLAKYFRVSYEYVWTLRPKATKKKKI